MKNFCFLLVLSLATAQPTTAQTDAPNMLAQALPAVVTVAVERGSPTQTFFGLAPATVSQPAYARYLDFLFESAGSGFIIELGGKKYVVTNVHVIESAASTDSIYVYSVNRTKYRMRVKAGDSFYDVAVLEFVDSPGPELATLELETAEPRVGETVYAIGNPEATHPYTVTNGIVSAMNRAFRTSTGLESASDKFGYIQHSAMITHGNSGGPLLNARGRVMGMNTLGEYDEQGIPLPQFNYALDGRLLSDLINRMFENGGRLERAFLGLEVTQQYSSILTENNVTWEIPSVDTGHTYPFIASILPGSPFAANASQLVGARLTKVNGSDVENIDDALEAFESIRPGTEVKLDLMQNGVPSELSVNSAKLGDDESSEIANFFFKQYTQYALAVRGGKLWVDPDENLANNGFAMVRPENSHIRGMGAMAAPSTPTAKKPSPKAPKETAAVAKPEAVDAIYFGDRIMGFHAYPVHNPAELGRVLRLAVYNGVFGIIDDDTTDPSNATPVFLYTNATTPVRAVIY